MCTENHEFNEEDTKITYGIDELEAVANDLENSSDAVGAKRSSASR